MDVEVGVQTVVTLVTNDSVKGGGAGAGVEGSVALFRNATETHTILARARTSLLAGDGLAYTFEAGAAWRWARLGRYQPELGVYLLYMGGDLARTIDRHGYLAENPWAVLGGVSPLRFALDDGWVSFSAVRAGTTLGGSSGHPAQAISISLFEVGRAF